MISEQQFRQMMPHAGARLDAHLPFINAALDEGRINTPRRIAAFMAQLAHESGEYRYMEELADGRAYEGRSDLGNTEPGDGVKFKGHGPIQITGRANHAACGAALGLDLIGSPKLIATPEHGTRSAVWFWNSRNLSPLADSIGSRPSRDASTAASTACPIVASIGTGFARSSACLMSSSTGKSFRSPNFSAGTICRPMASPARARSRHWRPSKRDTPARSPAPSKGETMLKFIRDRLKEPSTYAALGVILAAIGVNIDQGTIGAIAGGVVAVLGIILGEKSA